MIDAFHDLSTIRGPHLDMMQLLRRHYRAVAAISKKGAKPEEIGAYNLGFAHNALALIATELLMRRKAVYSYALKKIHKLVSESSNDVPKKLIEAVTHGFKLVDEEMRSQKPIPFPTTETIITEGDYLQELLKEEYSKIEHPMDISYINFLHKIVLTGLCPAKQRGKLRTVPVHIGIDSVQFPPPSLVKGMLDEFCRKFPTLEADPKYDPILKSADVSYRFASIHPYVDGNGRISRLLMNLVLWAYSYPPVYLKADKKGRHKYSQALKRANRGDLKPLACLIAMALADVYSRLQKSITL